MSNDPVLEEVLRRKAALLKQAYKYDRLLWLKEQVKTRDEHDFDNPVKPFPIKPYTGPLVKLFEDEQSFNLAKVRQIQATWLFCALAVHTIQFFDYKLALLISKKQEDAFKLIERMRFIYQHQDLWLRNLCPLDRQMRDQPQGHLYMRNGSSAMGLPQGPDQVRMHTASLILVDEAAFQDQLEETLAACNPSVMGGGKLVVFSSMLAGHFQRVCEITEPYKPNGSEVVKGLQVKENAEGVKVASLHYTADPDKDPDTEAGAKWLAASSRLYKGGRNSALWRREMEIDPQAGAGELVFPDFTDDEDKILCHPFDVGPTYKLYGGFDWGTRNPVSFHVYAYGPDGILYSIWEYYKQRQLLRDVAAAIRGCPFYDRLEWIASDPSMWTENQSTKDGFRSIAWMFMEDLPPELQLNKMMPAHGRSDMRAIQMIAGFWNEEPFIFRVSRTCPMQGAELRNLRYPQRLETKNDAEKILDKDNHSWDDLKYVVLSHPDIGSVEKKTKLGTYGYLNECSLAAERIARETGRPRDEVFREIYQSAPRV